MSTNPPASRGTNRVANRNTVARPPARSPERLLPLTGGRAVGTLQYTPPAGGPDGWFTDATWENFGSGRFLRSPDR